MVRHLILFAIVSISLLGCRMPEARTAAEADKVARVLGDFTASRKGLPSDIAARQTFADGEGYGVRWHQFSRIAFRPISATGIRFEFLDTNGASDYRIIFISARGLPPFVPDSASADTNGITLLL